MRGLRSIFVGTRGLRAGWGVTLFLLITVLITLVLIVVVAAAIAIGGLTRHLPAGGHVEGSLQSPSASTLALVEALLLSSLLGATWIMSVIERRPLAAYGFSASRMGRRFLEGLLAGLALLTLLIGLLWLSHAIQLSRTPTDVGASTVWGVKWAVVFLLVGVTEEVAMRGYLIQTLARGLNFRWGALISSAFFMALHVPNTGEGPLGLLQVFLIGLVFSYSIWKTGALWWAVGFHFAWDWSQSFVFGVADSGLVSPGALLIAKPMGPTWLSGGATGPEGSVLMFAVLTATVGLIALTLKKRDHPLAVAL
jgi:membrane protease YdiL (CAAX protease family)